MPVRMSRLNLVKGLGPVLQIAVGWTVEIDPEVHKLLDERTDRTWPTTWFVPRLCNKPAFEDVYSVMNNWGVNHGAISYGHIGADLITFCYMLRIPVAMHKPGVLDAAAALLERLKAAGVRAQMDDSDQSAGWKFAQYEMKGVPLRVEIGPKDMEKGQCCIARRDTGEKTFVPLTELENAVQQLLQDVHDNLYAMASKNLEDNTFDMTSWEEVKEMAQGKGGFARTKWCGSLECELAMKEKAGVSSRCMPLKQSGTVGKCPVCGKECTTDIYWGVAY